MTQPGENQPCGCGLCNGTWGNSAFAIILVLFILLAIIGCFIC